MPAHPVLLSLVVLRMDLHPPLLLLGRCEGISDRPEEHPGGCRAHVLELVLEILQHLAFALPKAGDVPLVVLRGNRFPSRHGDSDLVRSIYAYLRGDPRLVLGGPPGTPISAVWS